MDVVVLVSGGLDSVTALHAVAARHCVVAGLSFRYGARHNAREIPMAAWQCRRLGVPHRVFDLGFIGREFASALLKSGGDIPDGHYAARTMKQPWFRSATASCWPRPWDSRRASAPGAS